MGIEGASFAGPRPVRRGCRYAHRCGAWRLVDVTQVVAVWLKIVGGEKAFDHIGQKTPLLQFLQRDPFDPNLFFVVLGPRADAVRVRQRAAEHAFQLVKAAMCVAKLVVFADEFFSSLNFRLHVYFFARRFLTTNVKFANTRVT